MLLKGLNHVAVITHDASRLNDFYREVFDAEILRDGSEFPEGKGPRLSIIKIGDWAELNVFEIEGNTEADRQTPMFGRGRLDHLAVQAASVEAFETIRERLMARGAADDFVTDFGPMLSIFFRDPDGLECEVCVENPDLVPAPTTRRDRGARGWRACPDVKLFNILVHVLSETNRHAGHADILRGAARRARWERRRGSAAQRGRDTTFWEDHSREDRAGSPSRGSQSGLNRLRTSGRAPRRTGPGRARGRRRGAEPGDARRRHHARSDAPCRSWLHAAR